MQNESPNNEIPENDLRTENEIKKIKLQLEHGVNFSKAIVSPGLSPEIEGNFLDYMQQWEDQYAQRKMISVYELAEKPSFRPVSEIPESEIERELDCILAKLQQYSVHIDCLCEVAPKELYRFVTEELMNVETNDIRIEGMMHCFTYEEFHPNHEYDIKNRCTEVVQHLTDNTRSILVPWGFADNIFYEGELLTKEAANKKIIDFRESFSSITLHDFQFTEIIVNDAKDEAEAVSYIHYSGNIDGSSEKMEFKGPCHFSLAREYDWWTINKMEMPKGI